MQLQSFTNKTLLPLGRTPLLFLLLLAVDNLPTFSSARVIPGSSSNAPLMTHSISSISSSSASNPPPTSSSFSRLSRRQFGSTTCINSCYWNICQPRCGPAPATLEDGLCILNCQTVCTLECTLRDANSVPYSFTPGGTPDPDPAVNLDAVDEEMHGEVLEFVNKWNDDAMMVAEGKERR